MVLEKGYAKNWGKENKKTLFVSLQRESGKHNKTKLKKSIAYSMGYKNSINIASKLKKEVGTDFVKWVLLF